MNSKNGEIVQTPKLICFGNPLLDMSFKINDNEILSKYKININEQKEISIEELCELTADAKSRYKDFKVSLGGSSLNTCRILSKLGLKDFVFFGAIGDDENGKVVKNILKNFSSNICLQTLKGFGTGACICLVMEDNRSLIANIGAALHLKKDFVVQNLNRIPNINVSKNFITEISPHPVIFYIEGFFIPHKMDTCHYIYDNYCNNNNSSENLFITNLNAPYIVKEYFEDITYLATMADVLFGNRDEFEELAGISGLSSVNDLIENFLTDYSKTDRKKVIVITDGSNPVIFYEGNKNGIQSDFYNVPKLKKDDIVDTTGAGDSFVAGFIYSYLNKKSIMECVESGCLISSKVLRIIGCNLEI